jgi:anaerobic magnesium-protoporphyrin IX monomethyl ester cyclase
MIVSFVNPPIRPYKKIMRDFDCAGESKGNYLYQPYDFLLMSAFVPDDWDFDFFDAVAEECEFELFFKKIKDRNPQVIVCSVAGLNWDQDFKTIQQIRSKHPESFFFVFGDLFVDSPARKQIENMVDGIFSSPVLFDFRELLKFKRREDFKTNNYEAFHLIDSYQIKNLKAARQISVPRPKHEKFYHPSYRWPFNKSYQYTTIFTSWGCPYSCSYCILNKFPNFWRDYREIINEIIEVKKLGFREIYIGDKSFGLPLPNITQLLQEIIRLKLDISWSTYFHPNQYNPTLLNLMKRAGCHTIVIGIESKNLAELKRYGRHVTEKQLNDLLDHANQIGIEICADFIIGLPHDTHTSINELIRYSTDIKIDYASFNIATPLPGSTIRELALFENKIGFSDQGFDSSGKNQIISLGHITAADLLEYRNRAIRRFYLRPSYILRRLIRVRDLEHLQLQFEEGLQVIRSAFTESKV